MRFRLPFLSLLAPLALISGCTAPLRPDLPGRLADGTMRLPNGWYLSPAGDQVEVGELPLNMAVTPDGRYVITTDNGTARQSLSVIDIAAWKVVQQIPLRKSWVGIRMFAGGSRFLVSGGNDNRVDVYEFASGRGRRIDSLVIAPPRPAAKVWVGGVDIDEESGTVYAVG